MYYWVASTCLASLGPPALTSDVAVSLTGFQDGHNAIDILEDQVAQLQLQSVQHFHQPGHQTFLPSWPSSMSAPTASPVPLALDNGAGCEPDGLVFIS